MFIIIQTRSAQRRNLVALNFTGKYTKFKKLDINSDHHYKNKLHRLVDIINESRFISYSLVNVFAVEERNCINNMCYES